MRVVIDITHPAMVNFFKNAIITLEREENAEVSITALPRGKVLSILERECPRVPVAVLGRHRRSLPGKGLDLVRRCAQLLLHLRRQEPDVLSSFDDLGLGYVSRLLRKPLVTFEDDIENYFGFRRYRRFPTRVVVPSHLPVQGPNIHKYRGYKELAYLHPKYFTPRRESIERYGLDDGDFVFIREVSSGTVDYRHLVMGQLSRICPYLKALGFQILLSLEEKSLRQRFEQDCTILEEPVDDIFSLMHYAALTVSSGDTMARESCLLGTPAVYTGGREMAINSELQNMGCFFKADGQAHVLEVIKGIIDNDIKNKTAAAVAGAIHDDWEDTTRVIVDNIMEVAGNPRRRDGVQEG